MLILFQVVNKCCGEKKNEPKNRRFLVIPCFPHLKEELDLFFFIRPCFYLIYFFIFENILF